MSSNNKLSPSEWEEVEFEFAASINQPGYYNHD